MVHILQLWKSRIAIILMLLLIMQNCGKKVRNHPINTDNLLSKIVVDSSLVREITYNPEGLVTSWAWMKRDRTLLERKKFIYSSSHLKRVDTYNYVGQLVRYLTFEYNTDGILIQTNLYEQQNPGFAAFTPSQLREYILSLNPLFLVVDTIRKDAKALVVKPVYVGCEKYSYDSNNYVSKIDFFNQRMNQVGYCVYEHDPSGNLMNETWYDSDVENSVTCRYEYEYDNKNNLASNLNLPFVFETSYANNVVRKTGISLGETESESYSYEYNEKKYPVQRSTQNNDGEEVESVEYIYQP